MQKESVGLVLMSVALVQYGAVPLIVDFGSTHARSPSWPAHARFHVVTQALMGAAIAALAMFLLWSQSVERGIAVCLTMLLSSCVLGPFFVSAALRSIYGGALSDAAGGISKAKGIDLNVLNFGAATVALAAGRMML